MLTRSQIRQRNQQFIDCLSTPGLEKRAVLADKYFTRLKVREAGFTRPVMPPYTVADDELDRSFEHDYPILIIDKEPDCPPAATVAFRNQRQGFYLEAPKYVVNFTNVQSRLMRKHIHQLRTYTIDLRQVFNDNSLSQIFYIEDTAFLESVNSWLGGAAGATMVGGEIGKSAQWKEISGGVSREGLHEMMTFMPAGPGRFNPAVVLTNNLTIHDVLKFGRDEVGGDMSQEWFKNGWAGEEFMKCRWIVTTKHDLVPRYTFYMFADSSVLGRLYELQPVTMYAKADRQMISFNHEETIGLTLGNVYGLARADFKTGA